MKQTVQKTDGEGTDTDTGVDTDTNTNTNKSPASGQSHVAKKSEIKVVKPRKTQSGRQTAMAGDGDDGKRRSRLAKMSSGGDVAVDKVAGWLACWFGIANSNSGCTAEKYPKLSNL